MYIKLSMLPLLRRPREGKIGSFEAKAQNARDISDAWARLATLMYCCRFFFRTHLGFSLTAAVER